MPYKVSGPNAAGKYEVVNAETEVVKAEHETKEDADRQVRLLEKIESDPEWDKETNG